MLCNHLIPNDGGLPKKVTSLNTFLKCKLSIHSTVTSYEVTICCRTHLFNWNSSWR